MKNFPWTAIIRTILGIGAGIFGLFMLSDAIANLDTSEMTSAEKGIIEVLPIVFSAVVIVGVVSGFYGVKAVVKYKRWTDFGIRMKKAYSAKFGGENPGFNEEVDLRINIMRALKPNSRSKVIAEDWLKRMSAFVEIDFKVPEEEHLPEEEKTKILAEEENERYN